MNLDDLRRAARCTECNGYWQQPNPDPVLEAARALEAIGEDSSAILQERLWELEEWIPCPRCRDHPGIDPDVVLLMWRTSAMSRSFAATDDKDEADWFAVLVPLEDTP